MTPPPEQGLSSRPDEERQIARDVRAAADASPELVANPLQRLIALDASATLQVTSSPTSTSGKASESPSMEPSAKANILMVDDEPRNLYALRELLSSLNQNLILANSGEEALRCALKNDFAAILLDVRMPGMDGFETARMLRERERSRLTPIVFLTAAAEDLDSVRGYEVGAVDYLVKPVVPDVLKSKVSVFVELYKKSAELTKEIAERSLAEERVRESEEKLRALAAHLITVREDERAHIAREIHDELGQVLTGLKMDVGWLSSRIPDQKPLREKIESINNLIDSTIRTVREISTGLRPEVLDEMGLVAAINWQAKEFQKRTGFRCRLNLPKESAAGFDRDLSTTTFRIFQEILTNVARHSRASRVDVELKSTDDRLVLEVTDNGIGISDNDSRGRKSLGLLGMQERALRLGGQVSISGKPNHGTKVLVSIPIGSSGTTAAGGPTK
jgi:signal transduction histidine kinase